MLRLPSQRAGWSESLAVKIVRIPAEIGIEIAVGVLDRLQFGEVGHAFSLLGST